MWPKTQELPVHLFSHHNYSNYFNLLSLLVEKIKLILLFYICLVKLFPFHRQNPRLVSGWRSKPQDMRLDANILRKQNAGIPQMLAF
jgi:hypothetical protein